MALIRKAAPAQSNDFHNETSEPSLWKREKLYVLDWSGLGQCLQQIKEEILRDSFHPTTVVGISRGGLVPATYFSNALDVEDFVILGIARNTSNGTYSGKLEPELRWASTDRDYDGQKVLLVDDVAGEGKTLVFAEKFLKAKGAAQVQTVVIAKIQKCQFTPDYTGVELDDWIVFPWEKSVKNVEMILEPIRF